MQNYYEIPVLDQRKIGERIKQLRKENHLKVTDISDRMGFQTPQAVYKWQRGDCLPDYANMLVLSRMLGVSMEDILLGDEGMSSRIIWKYVIRGRK